MIENFFSSKLFGFAINSALNLDANASEKIACLEGKRISIFLDMFDEPWVFKIENGSLKSSAASDGQADVRLKGNLAGFMRLFKHNEYAAQSDNNEKLYIEGDLHAAQAFQSVMKDLKPDFYTVLTDRFGEKLGGILAEGLRQVQSGGTQAVSKVEGKLKDFLSDSETGGLTRAEFDHFTNRISSLQRKISAVEMRVRSRER